MHAYSQLTHNLVLVGKPTWFSPRVQEAARESGVDERIQFVGFVSDADLLQLYNACDCFVFPSFYEGFGFPALEAMAYQTKDIIDAVALLVDIPVSDKHSEIEKERIVNPCSVIPSRCVVAAGRQGQGRGQSGDRDAAAAQAE